MIAQLQGTVAHIDINEIIIDVGGVGYLVSVSSRTLGRINSVGEYIKILIETHVREDQISLFGFIDLEEKNWFKLLCTVQGVGAKVCLNILSVIPPEQLPIAIAAADKTAFTRADGVGPKLGTRIVTELKDKVAKFELGNISNVVDSGKVAKANINIQANNNNSDAISALINLGYGRSEAFSAVGQAAKELDNEPSIEKIIEYSLKLLSKT